MSVKLLRIVAAVAAILGTVANLAARADDDYPSRPITLTHGFGAGGNADAIARIVADGLARRLGKPVIVEARPGAGWQHCVRPRRESIAGWLYADHADGRPRGLGRVVQGVAVRPGRGFPD